MPLWLTITLIVGILFGCMFVGNGDAKTKQKIKDLFRGRPNRSKSDFYQSFFSDSSYSEELVTKVRSVFQDQFDVDLSQLEPDDDFSKDFRVIWDLDSMADVEIIWALEKTFKIKISDDEALHSKTFRDVVDLVYRKTEQDTAANP